MDNTKQNNTDNTVAPVGGGLLLKTSIFGLLVLIIVLGAGFYYFTTLTPKNSMAKFQQEYRDATATFVSGASLDESISEFERLISEAPDKTEEGKLKILLAANLFSRNNGEDRVESIKLYKGVTNDYSYPPFVRAIALNNVANLIREQNESFYKLHFNESPFADLMPTSGSENYKISKAYFNILKLSIETYPTSFAEYSIAGNYYGAAVSKVPNNDKVDRLEGMSAEEVSRLMQQYVYSGDSRPDDDLHIASVNVRKYLYRAQALSLSNDVLKNLNLREVEKAFSLPLESESFAISNNDQLSLFFYAQIRFFYADFLAQNYGEERVADIVQILKPFGEIAKSDAPYAKRVRNLFNERIQSKYNSIIKERSNELTELSPEFKEFIESL